MQTTHNSEYNYFIQTEGKDQLVLLLQIYVFLTLSRVWSERYFSPSRWAGVIGKAQGKVYNLKKISYY